MIDDEDIIYYCLTYPNGLFMLQTLAEGNRIFDVSGKIFWETPAAKDPERPPLEALSFQKWAQCVDEDSRAVWSITPAGRECACFARLLQRE